MEICLFTLRRCCSLYFNAVAKSVEALFSLVLRSVFLPPPTWMLFGFGRPFVAAVTVVRPSPLPLWPPSLAPFRFPALKVPIRKRSDETLDDGGGPPVSARSH